MNKSDVYVDKYTLSFEAIKIVHYNIYYCSITTTTLKYTKLQYTFFFDQIQLYVHVLKSLVGKFFTWVNYLLNSYYDIILKIILTLSKYFICAS